MRSAGRFEEPVGRRRGPSSPLAAGPILAGLGAAARQLTLAEIWFWIPKVLTSSYAGEIRGVSLARSALSNAGRLH